VPGFTEYKPLSNPRLSNKKFVRELLIDCLTQNDLETFQDVLISYIRSSAKVEFSKKTKIGRTTLYDLIDPKKPFNPTLDTLGKIFEELAA
jgi:DNA-binding phage protein